MKRCLLLLIILPSLLCLSQTPLKKPVYWYFVGDTIYASIDGKNEAVLVVKGLNGSSTGADSTSDPGYSSKNFARLQAKSKINYSDTLTLIETTDRTNRLLQNYFILSDTNQANRPLTLRYAVSLFAPIATVSFPGFGTSHATAAYGDHTHTGVYLPVSGAGDIYTHNASEFIKTETDPTIYAWAKAASKPTYTYSEVGADISGAAAAITLSGLGGVPSARKITSTIDLSADRNLTYSDVGAAPLSHTQAASTISDASTVGQNLVKLTNPSAITFIRINANNSVDALTASDFRTAIGAGGGGSDMMRADSNTTAHYISLTYAINNFLGIGATASNSSGLEGHAASYFQTAISGLNNGAKVDTLEFGGRYFAIKDSNTTKNPVTLTYAVANFLGIGATSANSSGLEGHAASYFQVALGYTPFSRADSNTSPGAVSLYYAVQHFMPLKSFADTVNWNTAFGWGSWAANFGTTIGTICQGSDSRLSDARTPTAHTQAISTISDASTVGQNLVKLTNPSAITFLQVNADNSVTAQSASAQVTAIGARSNGDSSAIAGTAGKYYTPTMAGSKADKSDTTNQIRKCSAAQGAFLSDTNKQVLYGDSSSVSGTAKKYVTPTMAAANYAPLSHAHGNITNAGAIGSSANLPIITTTSGVLTTGSFGTAANTFCQGNDSRLPTTAPSSAAYADTVEFWNRIFKGMIISFPLDSSYINITDTIWVDLPEYALTVDSISVSPNSSSGGAVVSYVPKFLYRTAPYQSCTAIITSPATITSSQAKTWQSTINAATLPANGQVGVLHTTVTTKPKQESIGIKVHR